jgi:hypothetical protein
MNKRIEESDASWNRAKRVAKARSKQGDKKGADQAIDNALYKETYRRATVAKKNAIKNPGVKGYLDHEAKTARRVRDIPRPATRGQGSFERMSQSVKEGLFNSYRFVGSIILEMRMRHGTKFTSYGRQRTDAERTAEREERAAAGSRTPKRAARLKDASAIARRREAEGKQADDQSAGRDANPMPNRR